MLRLQIASAKYFNGSNAATFYSTRNSLGGAKGLRSA
jgi:hypothetical protein